MRFSPVECVVRYVGMEDRYTLKHSYVRLPRQESFSKSHRLKPSAPTCYPLYHFWDCDDESRATSARAWPFLRLASCLQPDLSTRFEVVPEAPSARRAVTS